jgi:hypothetical protein
MGSHFAKAREARVSTGPGEGERPRIATERNLDWAVAPAEPLVEWFRVNDLTLSMVAGRCKDSRAVVAAIRDVLLRKPLTDGHAELLAEATGVPARIWLGLEDRYRRDLAAGRKDVTEEPFPRPGEECRG